MEGRPVEGRSMPPSCHGRHSDRLSHTLHARGRGWGEPLAPGNLVGEQRGERRGEGYIEGREGEGRRWRSSTGISLRSS